MKMANYPKSVVIEEQGLRDGLQGEAQVVPTAKKLEIIETLVAAGLKRIQVASFVNPQIIPQMADAEPTDDRLRLLIERVERLEEEKKGIADDIRDVYAEAKAVGYDTKIMRQIVRLRKMAPDDRREMEMVLDTYKAALGLG